MKHVYRVTADEFGYKSSTLVVAENGTEALEIAKHILFNLEELKEFDMERLPDIMIRTGHMVAEEIKPQEKGQEEGYRYYVTTYYCYPIYEKAEGGYYYSGSEIDKTYAFNDRKKAIRYINKLYRKHKAEPLPDRWTFHTNADNTCFGADGYYIGDGWFVKLERKLGSCVHGYEPYC